MKKTIILLLAAVLLVGTTGCNGPGTASTDTSVVSGEGGSTGNVSTVESFTSSFQPESHTVAKTSVSKTSKSLLEERKELHAIQDIIAPKMQEWGINATSIDGDKVIIHKKEITKEFKQKIWDLTGEKERIGFSTKEFEDYQWSSWTVTKPMPSDVSLKS